MRIAVESFGAVIDAATGDSLAGEAFAAEVERRGQGRAEIRVELHGGGLKRPRAQVGKKKGAPTSFIGSGAPGQDWPGAEIRPSYDPEARFWVSAGR